MSITSEQLKAILADQQSQFMKLLQNIQIGNAPPQQNPSQSNDMDLFCKLSAQISEFVYSPDDNRTFEEWYERFGPFVEQEGKPMSEQSKVRLIVSKLGTDEYKRYTESIQPTGDIFNFTGKCTIKAALNGEKGIYLDFYVVEKGSFDLLGLAWIRAFEQAYNKPVATTLKFDQPTHSVQIKGTECTPTQLKAELQAQFPNVFSDGLGMCTKFEAHLKLKENSSPVFCGSRPVPLGVQNEVDAELDRMIELGVLQKVDYSKWAAPIVAVRKANGKVRLCFDFSTGLNNALEPHHHPLPRPDELFAKLSGAKFFSQIDFKDAYLQICVDEQSRQLLGVNTHRGLYQCQRLACVLSKKAFIAGFSSSIRIR
ncbi:hypothetical protein niasHT_021255 [Heterodera trifolii]|uniref:DUF7083 domain-containing protein n=1 Tax=Heterodera trifolii TaxID=157864 RepID=A0ABD2JKF2_9BILA